MVQPGRRPLTQQGAMMQRNARQPPATAAVSPGAPQGPAGGPGQLGAALGQGMQQPNVAGQQGAPQAPPAGGGGQTVSGIGGTTPGYHYTGQGAWQTTSTGSEAGAPGQSLPTFTPGPQLGAGPQGYGPSPTGLRDPSLGGGAQGIGAMGYRERGGPNAVRAPTSALNLQPADSTGADLRSQHARGLAYAGGGYRPRPLAQGQMQQPGSSAAPVSGQQLGKGGRGQGQQSTGQGVGTSSAGLGANTGAGDVVTQNTAQAGENTQAAADAAAAAYTEQTGHQTYPPGQNGLPDPNDLGAALSGQLHGDDNFMRARGADGNDYVWNDETGRWEQYVNKKGYDPRSGTPYGQRGNDLWAAAGNTSPPMPNDTVYDTEAGEVLVWTNQGWRTQEQAQGMRSGQQGGGSNTAKYGYYVDPATGFAYDTETNRQLSPDEVRERELAAKEKEALEKIHFPESGLTDEDIQQKLAADRRQRAFETSKAIRLAMELGEGGAPEAQAASVVGTQQQADIAGQAQDARTNLEYQKMQAEYNIAAYQAELEKTLIEISSAQTREGRAAAERAARTLLAQQSRERERLIRLDHELSQPSAGEVVGSIFGSLLGPIGGGFGQASGKKVFG